MNRKNDGFPELQQDIINECGNFLEGKRNTKNKNYDHILTWSWDFNHCNKLGQILMWVRVALFGNSHKIFYKLKRVRMV